MDIQYSDAQNMPLPDLIFCCSNICNTVIKWYENIAKELDIPMILFDLPFNHEYEVNAQNVKYIKSQFLYAIGKLEQITGEKFDYDRFAEVMKISSQTSVCGRKLRFLPGTSPSPERIRSCSIIWQSSSVCGERKKAWSCSNSGMTSFRKRRGKGSGPGRTVKRNIG
jgi:benzoyl-CoA reductase/2-hydroxyglutaryl-CoA dehydratase subunit BcrC/BadD/HgdB